MNRRRPKKTPAAALGAAVLLLAGCGAPTLRPLDARHPASAEAPEGALEEPSALDAAPPEPVPGSPMPPSHHHGAEARHAH